MAWGYSQRVLFFLTATRRGRTPAAVLVYSAFLLFICVHELFYTGKYRSVPLLICIPLLIVRLLFAMRSKKKEETDAQIQFVDLSICSNIRSGVRYKPQTADGKFLNASQSKSVLTDEIKQESPSDWALPETRKETARRFPLHRRGNPLRALVFLRFGIHWAIAWNSGGTLGNDLLCHGCLSPSLAYRQGFYPYPAHHRRTFTWAELAPMKLVGRWGMALVGQKIVYRKYM